jgi:hypothetical protein
MAQSGHADRALQSAFVGKADIVWAGAERALTRPNTASRLLQERSLYAQLYQGGAENGGYPASESGWSG